MPIFARKHKKPLSIYVHVPFCRSKCIYCDFYSRCDAQLREKHPDLDCAQLREDYTNAVCEHIREASEAASLHIVDTIYFGGGTPSYLGGEELSLILATIRKYYDVSDHAEITFEANPDSVTDKLLRRLRSEGFNRVSLGIQTDDDAQLKFLGRAHNYAQAVEAVQKIRRNGFRNLNVDLMFGLPGQTIQNWIHALATTVKLSPEHISCYGLEIKKGTPLYDISPELDIPDDDLQADMYLSAISFLADKGYRQYEISNFCKKGKVSRHNLKYWQCSEFLSFGPSAASYFGGQRFTIVADVADYINGIREKGQVIEEVEDISFREQAKEFIMMRLRTVYGIDPVEYERKYLLPFAPLAEKLEEYRKQGFVARTFDGRWHLTGKGFLISNYIKSDLLLIQEKCKPIAKRKR